MGAVAGQINGYEEIEDDEEEIKVSGNFYVGDDIYGIDNISYTGVAEPITYQELLTVENLPGEFWHLKVIYKIEDTYLGSEEIKYGEALNALNYPEIPVKEGYYGVWEDVTDRTMKGTLVVEAEYRDNVAVVQSGNGEDAGEGSPKKPYALENSGLGASDSFAVRLLNPYDQAVVWAYRGGYGDGKERSHALCGQPC